MAFGSFGGNRPNSTPMAEINMVPLIDVMLVLLVIFIITAPLLTNAVKINLPTASSEVLKTEPDKIDFAINQDGEIFWNGEPVSMADATLRLQEAGKKEPTPEIHIRADRETKYQVLAEVMAAAAKAGVTKMGFVSDPGAGAGTSTGTTGDGNGNDGRRHGDHGRGGPHREGMGGEPPPG